MNFEIVESPIDVSLCRSRLQQSQCGGFVCFEGWVRDHNDGAAVSFLEYEAFKSLAEKEAKKITDEAKQRYDVDDVISVHRVGSLKIGEIAVWIGASSAHRDAAFRACRYVIDEIKTRLPIWKKEHYRDGRAEWVNCQECYKHSHHYNNENEKTEFYSRQMSLPNMGRERLETLGTKTAVVIGAGGLGCPVMQSLAGSGVGRILIYDGDRLEISNLHRQSIYKFVDVGQSKAILAEEYLRSYNPFIQVVGYNLRIGFDNVLDVLEEADIVFDCTDNFISKFLIHDACLLQRTPLVQASIYQYEGEVQLYENNSGGETPCLRCYQPDIPSANCTGNCQEAGVMGYTAQVVGHLQAKLGIDQLLGTPESRKVIVDLESLEVSKIKGARREGCQYCVDLQTAEKEWVGSRYESLIESFEILAENLEEITSKYTLIDIRRSEEYSETDNVADIGTNGETDQLLSGLDKDQKYLVICQRGQRSFRLVEKLREKKIDNFYSLHRGIESINL